LEIVRFPGVAVVAGAAVVLGDAAGPFGAVAWVAGGAPRAGCARGATATGAVVGSAGSVLGSGALEGSAGARGMEPLAVPS